MDSYIELSAFVLGFPHPPLLGNRESPADEKNRVARGGHHSRNFSFLH